MFNAERTIYSKKIQNRMKCGLDYNPILNTTLNEKFDIYPTDNVLDIRYPTLNLITIGCGVTDNIDMTTTRLNMYSSPHTAIDAALFKHVPLYMRPLADVVNYPASDRLRLKKIMSFNGTDYLVYYGYSIANYEATDVITTYTGIENDYVSIAELAIAGDTVLNPIPKPNINIDTKKYISDFVKFYTFISEAELIEIKNAFSIMYPDITPVITEIGVCSSKETTLDNNLVNLQTQVNYFLDVNHNVDDALLKGKLDFYIEVGDMEIIAV